MAELHKNQVAWSAPDPTHVQLEKRQDYIADEAKQLAGAMDRFAEIKADIEDKTAAVNLDQTAREAYAELSKEEPSDNNFDRALEKYNSKINTALNSLSPDVRKRFLRDNPDFLARQELNANEVIFEKQQKFAQAEIKTAWPKIASRVVSEEISYEHGKKLMQDLVKDTNNAFATEVLFDFDRSITKAKLENLLMEGRYSDVISYVSTVEKKKEDGEDVEVGIVLDTLTPAERIEFIKSANQLAKAEASEREKLLNSVKSGTGTDVENVLLEAGYATLDLSGSETAEFLNSLDKPNVTIKTKDDKELYFGNVPSSIRTEVRAKIRKAAEDRGNWRKNASRTTQQVNSIIGAYKQSTVDDTKDSQEQFVQLSNLRNSHEYEYLPEETKDELDKIVDGQNIRLYNHLKTNKEDNLYTGMFSVGGLGNDILQGAGIGAVSGGAIFGAGGTLTGGPLVGVGLGATGAVIGGLTGAGVGLVSGLTPTKKFEGWTGLKALEQAGLERPAEMSHVYHYEDEASKLMSKLTQMSYENVATMSPIMKGQHRVPENLSNIQRVYRQATTYARDNFYVGDKEIKYGTSAEFVLNMGTKLLALNNFGVDGRARLGIKNVSDEHLMDTINYMHGLLQNGGEYDVILQEIKDSQKAESYTRSLFDNFVTILTKGAGADEGDEFKKARDELYKELVEATKGNGGKWGSFTPTEMSVVDEEKLYPYANESSVKEAYKTDLKQKG